MIGFGLSAASLAKELATAGSGISELDRYTSKIKWSSNSPKKEASAYLRVWVGVNPSFASRQITFTARGKSKWGISTEEYKGDECSVTFTLNPERDLQRMRWKAPAQHPGRQLYSVILGSSEETFSVWLPGGYYTLVLAGNEKANIDLYASWEQPTEHSYGGSSTSSSSLEYLTVYGKGRLSIRVKFCGGSGHWALRVIEGKYAVSSGRRSGTLSGEGDEYCYVTYEYLSFEGSGTKGGGMAWVFLSGPDSSNFGLYVRWNAVPSTEAFDAPYWLHWGEQSRWAIPTVVAS